MDPVLDRVRAANPASEKEFAGRADFATLTPPPRRRRRRLLAIPGLAAVAAALVVLPNSAPQASEVLEQAVKAIDVDGGILYARSTTNYGAREVWVRGEEAMRFKQTGGVEEVYARGEGVTVRDAAGQITRRPESQMVPTEIFRVGGLLERARDVGLEETDSAYVLRWYEHPARMTLWVDKKTYAPLRFEDRSARSLYTERILEFERLPDTPENRRLLELG
jgi:hypothetical protein